MCNNGNYSPANHTRQPVSKHPQLLLCSLSSSNCTQFNSSLYRLEIVGLKALWCIVLGRRKNVLKSKCQQLHKIKILHHSLISVLSDRMESYDYKHSQLFLATLFFSGLLFLLPTVLVYYVVFSTVSELIANISLL